MKKIIISLLVLLFLSSCESNEDKIKNNIPGIYKTTISKKIENGFISITTYELLDSFENYCEYSNINYKLISDDGSSENLDFVTLFKGKYKITDSTIIKIKDPTTYFHNPSDQTRDKYTYNFMKEYFDANFNQAILINDTLRTIELTNTKFVFSIENERRASIKIKDEKINNAQDFYNYIKEGDFNVNYLFEPFNNSQFNSKMIFNAFKPNESYFDNQDRIVVNKNTDNEVRYKIGPLFEIESNKVVVFIYAIKYKFGEAEVCHVCFPMFTVLNFNKINNNWELVSKIENWKGSSGSWGNPDKIENVIHNNVKCFKISGGYYAQGQGVSYEEFYDAINLNKIDSIDF